MTITANRPVPHGGSDSSTHNALRENALTFPNRVAVMVMVDSNTEAVARAVAVLGSQGRLAQACGVSQAAVWKWLQGQPPKGEHAVAIEVATGGQVSREAIRPDLFV